MTLVVALAGRNEIVIGADGICPIGNGDGEYAIETQKLRRILKDKWVAGIAGTRSGYTLLEKAGAGSKESVFDLSARMAEVYKVEYSVELRLVFAGFENNIPSLYTWNGLRWPDGSSVVNGLTLAEEGRVAIGFRKHGALHFMHAYHSIEMNVNQLAMLCYYCLSEAVRQDTRLDEPISMAVISRDAITDLDDAQIKELRAASTRIRRNIGKLFIKNAPTLYANRSAIDQT
jgi:20S proteasome alpha/beta subunit